MKTDIKVKVRHDGTAVVASWVENVYHIADLRLFRGLQPRMPRH